MPGTLINSYPMNFQSPEARLAVRINRQLDWNFGYQYYNYRESLLVGPRPQNYHAHLPSMSLRVVLAAKNSLNRWLGCQRFSNKLRLQYSTQLEFALCLNSER